WPPAIVLCRRSRGRSSRSKDEISKKPSEQEDIYTSRGLVLALSRPAEAVVRYDVSAQAWPLQQYRQLVGFCDGKEGGRGRPFYQVSAVSHTIHPHTLSPSLSLCTQSSSRSRKFLAGRSHTSPSRCVQFGKIRAGN